MSASTPRLFAVLLPFALVACTSAVIDVGPGTGTVQEADADTDADSDADSDSDSDSDTDSDTDTDADVAGTYEGSFLIEGSVPDFGLSDSCEGEIRLTVDPDDDPQIYGIGTCEFEGILNQFGEQDGVVTGDLRDSEAEGDIEVTFAGQIIEAEWAGQFEDDGFDGSFEGEFLFVDDTFGEVYVDYEGFWDTVLD